MPRYWGGLWLAVKLTAPTAPLRRISNASTGVGNRTDAHLRREAVPNEDGRGLRGETVGQEARVVPHEHKTPGPAVGGEHARDRRDHAAGVAERELLGQDGAPAGRPEADRLRVIRRGHPVKVTRLLRTAAWTAAATAVACAAGSGVRETAGLSVRNPDLTHPLREPYPERRDAEPRGRRRAGRLRPHQRRPRTPPACRPSRGTRAPPGRPDAFCAAQVRERTRGHFLMDGLPPYARTALAGVFGVGPENSAIWVSSGKASSRSA